jgi:hypothetical protein
MSLWIALFLIRTLLICSFGLVGRRFIGRSGRTKMSSFICGKTNGPRDKDGRLFATRAYEHAKVEVSNLAEEVASRKCDPIP